jgi:hypothetical protein
MRQKMKCGMSVSWRIAILVAIFFSMTQRASAQFIVPGRHPTRGQLQLPDPSPSDSAKDVNDAKDAGLLSLWTPLKPRMQEEPYHPILPQERLRWFTTNTIGPAHLFGGIVAAGLGTALDRPSEYGRHWSGIGERYDIRMTGIATGNAIEAGVGDLIGEDPRYFRVQNLPFKGRVRNAVRLTFLARHEDGTYGPAYARYLAIAGNNFLSNTWRVPSEANVQGALVRTAEGFAGRMAANAFEEFWPDIKRRVFHRRN